ncbi:Hypothetical predicted protein, partial [Paramuricea clavata]
RKIAIFLHKSKSGICNEVNWLWATPNVSVLCSTMNIPPLVGSKPFREHTKVIQWAATDVAEQTIKDAAQKSTTPRLRTVKTLWKLLFHAMEHGKEGDLPRRTDVKPSFPWKMEKFWT